MLRRLLVALACLVAVFAAVPAAAQTASSSSGSSSGGTSTSTSGSENITAGVANPERYLYENGVCNGCKATDVTNTPRPQNLNPEGVNFTDCEQNLRMDFTLVLSGFSSQDEASVQAWAGTEDCTQDTNRVSTAGTLHACWQIAGFYGPVLATTSQTITVSVYARDVLRYSAQPISSTDVTQSYDSTFNYSAAGESACHVQTTDAAVPISIYFIPVNSTSNAIGTAYEYSLSTDLVAPPPPATNALATGDTLLTISWTSPGTDPDIVGYAVYSDPPAGGATTGGCSCGSGVGSGANSYVGDGAIDIEDATAGNRCMEAEVDGETDGSDAVADAEPEAAATPTADAESDDAEALEASLSDGGVIGDAGTTGDGGATGGVDSGTGVVDSGFPVNCNPINMGGSGDGGSSSCADLLLTAHQFIVNGTTTVTTADGAVEVVEASTTTTTVDVDGEAVEGGVTLSGGGISEIPPRYKAGEIDSVTATSLTLTGLTNGTVYHVGVTSIDGSGNVGPMSPLQCQKPGAVNDFWQSYKDDGGSAGGCALESGGNAQTGSVFGLGMFAAAAALLRRRRR